jgi:hypothetical protein
MEERDVVEGRCRLSRIDGAKIEGANIEEENIQVRRSRESGEGKISSIDFSFSQFEVQDLVIAGEFTLNPTSRVRVSRATTTLYYCLLLYFIMVVLIGLLFSWFLYILHINDHVVVDEVSSNLFGEAGGSVI